MTRFDLFLVTVLEEAELVRVRVERALRRRRRP